MYFKSVKYNKYTCFIGDVPLPHLYKMVGWLKNNKHKYTVTCKHSETGYRLWLPDETLITMMFFLVSNEEVV